MAQYAQNATYANLTFDFSDKIVVVTGEGSGIGSPSRMPSPALVQPW